MPIIKVKAGRFMVPMTVSDHANGWALRFGFSRILIAEVKAMQGSKWDPDGKFWTVSSSQRNTFASDHYLTTRLRCYNKS